METLTLNDGTIIKNATTFNAVVGLWIHVLGITMSDAFAIFSDVNKTKRITTDIVLPHNPDEPIVYEGFTNLMMIRQDDSGETIIELQKEG